MSAFVNLRNQVKNVLRLRNGGVGNQNGWARGVIKLCSNRTGGTLPRYSLVRLESVYNDARVELTDTDAELTVLGVVVGYFDPDNPDAIIKDDAPDLANVAVLTTGSTRVLVGTGGATRGEYAYASGTDDGAAYSDSAPLAGAFGIFQGSGSASATAIVRLWGAIATSSGSGATFGTPAIVLGTVAAAGSIDEVIRRDSTIVAFDATVPTTAAFGDSAATGSVALAARRDHVHGMPANPTSFATPSIALGTAAAAGAAGTVIRSDATIEAFDATNPAAIGTAAPGASGHAARRDHVHPTGAGTPTTLAFGDSPATGTGPAAAMTDHVHGMPAGPPAGTVALGLYGNGHDGDLTLDGSVTPSTNLMTKSGSVYTLARDAFWENLTIDSGVTLITAGLKFFVRGTLTVNGTIHRNGNNGGSPTAGGALSQITTGASQAGGAGATSDANGSNGNAVSTNGSAGGPAGNGGISGTGRTGGVGGSARDDDGATVNAPNQGGLSSTSNTRGRPLSAVGFMLGFWSIGGAASQFWEGGAGAGGGARGPSAGTGGGGGGGGGVVVILASQVEVGATGVISANGGNGANGSGTNAGGGGGGGGGVVAIMTDSYTVAGGGAVTATGGNFGTGAGGGGNGGAGGDGNVYVMLNV